MTVATLIDQARYELNDTSVTGEKRFSDAELLNYFNNWYGIIHRLLVMDRSELVRSGSGTITTVAGTYEYSLTTASMSDFWTPHRVWIAGSDAMELKNESWIKDGAYESSDGTISRAQPSYFYLEGDNIGLLPAPDAVYTVKVKYYPRFAAITDDSNDTPLLRMFDSQLIAGIVMTAKTRGRLNPSIEASMVKLTQDIGMEIIRMRRESDYQFYPEDY